VAEALRGTVFEPFLLDEPAYSHNSGGQDFRPFKGFISAARDLVTRAFLG
jgi:hypothetical protein